MKFIQQQLHFFYDCLFYRIGKTEKLRWRDASGDGCSCSGYTVFRFCLYAFHDSFFRSDMEVQRSSLTPCRSPAIEVALIFLRGDLRVFSVLWYWWYCESIMCHVVDWLTHLESSWHFLYSCAYWNTSQIRIWNRSSSRRRRPRWQTGVPFSLGVD